MKKYITKYFWYFCITAIFLTIGLYSGIYWGLINPENGNSIFICSSLIYGLSMFLSGMYFGKKNGLNAALFDGGVFIHLASYLIWGIVSITWMQITFSVINFSSVLTVLFFWGIGLFFHVLPFIKRNKLTLSGYDKEEIFE